MNFLLSKVMSKIETFNSKLYYPETPEKGKALLKELESLQILARSLAKMSAILEVLITRVETLVLLNITAKDLVTIKGVVQELKKYSFNIPELSIIIEDVDDKVNDLIHDVKGDFRELSMSMPVTEDVKKIINEAEMIAKSKLKNLEEHLNPIKT